MIVVTHHSTVPPSEESFAMACSTDTLLLVFTEPSHTSRLSCTLPMVSARAITRAPEIVNSVGLMGLPSASITFSPMHTANLATGGRGITRSIGGLIVSRYSAEAESAGSALAVTCAAIEARIATRSATVYLAHVLLHLFMVPVYALYQLSVLHVRVNGGQRRSQEREHGGEQGDHRQHDGNRDQVGCPAVRGYVPVAHGAGRRGGEVKPVPGADVLREREQ